MTARYHVTLTLRAWDPVEPTLSEGAFEPPARAHRAPHLSWWVDTAEAPVPTVSAHYLFDDAYARAHPEALDRAHLTLLQGLVNLKAFDDGERVLHGATLEGALRWPAEGERRASLAGR
ncbi:MAG: hypothetical protein HY909_09065 [Deltaproteobacteria bacterium]|nr:hypothetical protein [Deltaproteobacteria bacterium]